MNSRQRVIAALSPDQIPDRVPWVEQLVHHNVVSQLTGRDLVDPITQQQTDEKAIIEYHTIAADVYAELALDGISCPAWTNGIADPVYRNGQIVPRTCQPAIFDWQSFNQRAKEYPAPEEMPFAKQLPAWSQAMSQNQMFHILAVGMQYRLLEVSIGFENMAVWNVEQPDLLHAAANFFCDWTCAAIEMILKRCDLDAVWLDDDLAFKTATFVSPAMLREYVFPYHRRTVQVVKEHGLPTLFHSDGNLSAILDDLIDSGFVSLHPLERLAFDIRAARKALGHRITLMGNVDIDFLERGDPETCFNEAASLIAELGPRRYIITSGNSITANVKPENLKAMSRAVRVSCT